MIGLLLDLGNIVFTIGSLPQIYSSFKYRYKLKGLSISSFVLYIIATLCFLPVMVWTNAWIAFICGCFNIFSFLWNVYWILRLRNKHD